MNRINLAGVGTVDVESVKERILYHSYFSNGVQYVTLGGKAYKVNGIVNLLRIWNAL